MRKLKTIYDRLKPEFKTELQNNVRKYDSAKRLKYKLMSSNLWHDLTFGDFNDISVFCNVDTYELSANDVRFGSGILND